MCIVLHCVIIIIIYFITSRSIVSSEVKELRNTRSVSGRHFFYVCYAYLFINNLFHNYRTEMAGLDEGTLAAINDVWSKELCALDLPTVTNESAELQPLMSTGNIVCIIKCVIT